MKLLLLCLLIPATHVEIYTANFAPFSYDGKGFSIDYLQEIIVRTFGTNQLTTHLNIVDNNAQIFSSVLAYNNTDSNFAMGTAGISITPARVELGVFLPAFYREGGLRVMVHTQNSFGETAKRTVSNFFLAFGLMVLAVFVLILFHLHGSSSFSSLGMRFPSL
uniref:Uncharacterized protein n=1 Tax=viral metagenome TaxID=1070528 RepID=A0A6C0EM89_9ZZZZ